MPKAPPEDEGMSPAQPKSGSAHVRIKPLLACQLECTVPVSCKDSLDGVPAALEPDVYSTFPVISGVAGYIVGGGSLLTASEAYQTNVVACQVAAAAP